MICEVFIWSLSCCAFLETCQALGRERVYLFGDFLLFCFLFSFKIIVLFSLYITIMLYTYLNIQSVKMATISKNQVKVT